MDYMVSGIERVITLTKIKISMMILEQLQAFCQALEAHKRNIAIFGGVQGNDDDINFVPRRAPTVVIALKKSRPLH